MAVFEVYADAMLIHHSQSPDPKVKLLEPNLKLAVNSAGSFKFKVPPSNCAYGDDDFGNPYINRLTTFITVKKDGTEIWCGRIITEESDFWNNRTFTCEGELAFLNDTSQPPKEYHDMTVTGFLQALINIHNEKADAGKHFTVGIVTVTDPNDSLYRYTNFESTMEAIKDKMVNRLGGYLRVRRENGVRYLDYLKEPINTNAQTIEFGRNLLDFSKSWDLTEFVTVVIPQGERLEEHPIDPETGEPIEALDAYLDVSSVNGGSIYVYDQETVDNYGWIESIVHWDDVTDPQNLLSKGEAYLRDIQFDNMELEVSAVDMSYMIGSQEPMIRLFDKVHCKSKPHGLDRFFPVVEIEIPLDNPENTTFTLGDRKVRTSLTASLKAENDSIREKVSDLPSTTYLIDTILEEAYNRASQLLDQNLTGYVNVVTSDVGGTHSERLVISDTKDWTEASRYWSFGIAGLGHYTRNPSTGQTKLTGVAITMDGEINATMISVGKLNAEIIKVGELSDVYGYNYWNLETGELRMSAGAKIGGKTAEEIAAEQAAAEVNNFINSTYNEDMSDIGEQIDKKAETWYQDDDPSGNWYKPSQGIDERAEHVGDLWYKTKDGENTTWIYRKENGVYKWVQEDVPKHVFDTIDGKAQVFITEPLSPYFVGDMWVVANNYKEVAIRGEILTCLTTNKSDNPKIFVRSEWGKKNKYTDDEELTKFITNTYDPDFIDLSKQVDRRAETYYQDTDPALEWDRGGHGTSITFGPGCETESTLYDWIDIYYATVDSNGDPKYSYIRFGGAFGSSQINIPASNFLIFWRTDFSVHDYYGWKITSVSAYSGSNYMTPTATGLTSLPEYTELIDATVESLESSHNPYEDNLRTIYITNKHRGDLWYNTSNNTTWRYNGIAWERQNVPDSVFDAIDGKAQIFISNSANYHPDPPYNIGDTWFQGDYQDKEIKSCVVKKDGETPGQTTYEVTDFAKKNKYTDDSAVKNLNAALDWKEIYTRLTNGGENQGVFSQYVQGVLKFFINAQYITTGYLSDKNNYNYWNLENGDFRLTSRAKLRMDCDYTGGYRPTVNDYPSNNWTTDDLKEQNLGKTFLYESSSVNEAYKWSKRASSVYVRFSKFDTEEIHDYVRFYFRAENGKWYCTQKYSGNFVTGVEFYVPSTHFYMEWESDGSVQYDGWTIANIYVTGDDAPSSLQLTEVSGLPIGVTYTIHGTSSLPSHLYYGKYEHLLYEFDTQLNNITYYWDYLGSTLGDVMNNLNDGTERLINASLDQETIFNKLTDNGELQGVYMENGELFVNASYIRTGEMVADRIRGGTLQSNDSRDDPNFKLELRDGALTAKKFSLSTPNLEITTYGEIISKSSSLRTVVDDGYIQFYTENDYGTRKLMGQIEGYELQETYWNAINCLRIESTGALYLMAPEGIYMNGTKASNGGTTWIRASDGGVFGLNFENGIWTGTTTHTSGGGYSGDIVKSISYDGDEIHLYNVDYSINGNYGHGEIWFRLPSWDYVYVDQGSVREP